MEERTYDVRNAIKMLPNEQLRRERQRRGWSREYVAEQIGVADPKTIGRWERGVAFPSSFFLQKLCNLFGMLAQDLGLFPANHDSELQAVAGYLESAGLERYTLHQAITDYTGQYNSAAYERMVEYFIRYVETHETDFDALERETSTILAALQVAFERGMSTLLIRGAIPFSLFLESRGLYELAETYLQRAEQAARSLGDLAIQVKVLYHQGRIADLRGDTARAEALMQKALTLARQIGYSHTVCAPLENEAGQRIKDRVAAVFSSVG
jgi:transcriptional regulator with XRE-family HTH domain